MKKSLFVILGLVLCLNINAQTTLTEAVNFISLDDKDQRVELFEVLERGQCAFLYFFFSDAESTPVFDPHVVEAYEQLGSNQGDVFFIGVAPVDDSLTIANWKRVYGAEFPVIHERAKAGQKASNICLDYGVKVFATAVLIAPDRRILIDNIWPINSTQQLLDEFEAAMSTIDVAEVKENSFKVYPNPASGFINITSELNGEAEVNIFDMAGRCVKNVIINDISNATIDISDVDKGVYFINVNGKVEKLVVE